MWWIVAGVVVFFVLVLVVNRRRGASTGSSTGHDSFRDAGYVHGAPSNAIHGPASGHNAGPGA